MKLSFRKFFSYETLLTLCTLIIYSGIYSLDFQMNWDDYWVVINSYTEKGITVTNLLSVFLDFYHAQYAPVNELYYILISYLDGYNPLFFHLASLLIHVSNVLLTYNLIIRITNTALNQPVQVAKKVAFYTALIFALHPLNLESVAWISASKIVVYAFFYLLALHTYISYIIKKDINYLILSIVFFALSFGGKEQAVTYPVCIVMLDFLFNQNFRSKSYYIEKSVIFFLALFFSIITIKSQGEVTDEVFDNYKLHERLILAFYTFSEYLTKCIIPVKLSYAYPFPFKSGGQIPAWLFIYPVLLITLVVVSVRRTLSSKWMIFGLSFFIIHIVIALHLINLARHSVIADRYAYLSTIGIAFIITYFTFIRKGNHFNRKYSYIVFYSYIFCMSIYTKLHLPVWENSETLKREVGRVIKSRKDYQMLKKKYAEK